MQISCLTQQLRLCGDLSSTGRLLDSPLGSGASLADELRDMVDVSDCSTSTGGGGGGPPSTSRGRKRPSSILSEVIAKMDQSTCYADATLDGPTKRTRLSSLQLQFSSTISVEELSSQVAGFREALERLMVR